MADSYVHYKEMVQVGSWLEFLTALNSFKVS